MIRKDYDSSGNLVWDNKKEIIKLIALKYAHKFRGDNSLKIRKGSLNTDASEILSIYKILFRKDATNFEEATTGIKYYFSTCIY